MKVFSNKDIKIFFGDYIRFIDVYSSRSNSSYKYN